MAVSLTHKLRVLAFQTEQQRKLDADTTFCFLPEEAKRRADFRRRFQADVAFARARHEARRQAYDTAREQARVNGDWSES